MMTTALLLCVALGATTEIEAAPATHAPAPTKIGLVSAYRQVAMMPLSSLGSTDEVATAIERVLIAEITNLVGDRLITPSMLLERGKDARDAFLDCESVVVCLVEVIGGLGWDAFIVGNIAGLGDDLIINLKLIDVRTGGEVRRASESTTGEESALISKMRRAAVTLLAPEMLVGIVDLQCSQSDVQIVIDGQVIGTTPLKNTRVELPVGRHAIEANGDGLVPFSNMIDIAYGETKTIEIELPSNTLFIGGSTPFRSRWWTWTLAGAGVLTAGLGGLFNGLQANTVGRINARASAGTLTIEHRDLYQEEALFWYTALSFYIAGAALLTTVTALLGFDVIF